MKKVFPFFLTVLFSMIFTYQSFGCNASTSSQFVTCANNGSDINVKSSYTVTDIVDLSDMEVDLGGNNDLTLNENNTINAGTSFKGGGNSSLTIGSVTFTKNSSPTFAELNAEIATGNHSTLGGAVSAIVPLPVTLSFFRAQRMADGVLIMWETATEINNKEFEVLKSKNGRDWESLAVIEGKGNSSESNLYQITDTTPSSGLNFYRLKQIDFDGNYELFNVVTIEALLTASEINVFPNPTTTGIINLEVSDNLDINLITVRNQMGKLLFSSKSFISSINFSAFPKGLFFIEINSTEGRETKKVFNL